MTGDVAVDWMVAVPTSAGGTALEKAYQWEARNAVHLIAQPGSAALLSMLLSACVAAPVDESGSVQVVGPDIPPDALTNPNQTALTRAYSIWQLYPVQAGSNEPAMRMHEYLGQKPGIAAQPPARNPTGDAPICLVIDDTGLRFRDAPADWPACLRATEHGPAHILLKMSTPLATGPLWEELIAHHADALTLYCSVNDLRKEFAPIGQPLSWERTSSDVVRAVMGRADLAHVPRVIVSLGLSGAVVIERGSAQTLIFDPMHQEGDWERSRPGVAFGLGTCMMAALALACARSPDAPDWLGGVRRGLEAGRALHTHGYLLAG